MELGRDESYATAILKRGAKVTVRTAKMEMHAWYSSRCLLHEERPIPHTGPYHFHATPHNFTIPDDIMGKHLPLDHLHWSSVHRIPMPLDHLPLVEQLLVEAPLVSPLTDISDIWQWLRRRSSSSKRHGFGGGAAGSSIRRLLRRLQKVTGARGDVGAPRPCSFSASISELCRFRDGRSCWYVSELTYASASLIDIAEATLFHC